MKLKFLAITLLAAVSFLGFAQDGSGPKLQMEKMSHDFGDIDKGSKVSTAFQFTNTGDAPLEIKNVKTSCGCTSAKPEKSVFQPGEAGEIPVTFNSGRFSGKISKSVTILTNEVAENGGEAQTVVKITANVVTDIVAKPMSLFFPRAKTGQVAKQEITVSTNKLDRLEISDIKSQPAYVTVDQQRVDEKTVKLIVTVDGAQFPEGKSRLSGYLTYKTNSESQADMRASVTINIQKPLRVTPGSVFMFASKKGKERKINLRVESSEEKDFKLSDIKSSLDYLNVAVAEDGAKQKRLEVTLSDKAPVGKFNGTITMNTDLDAQARVVIPIRGSVVEPQK
ncbi:DUF1573 domain-containing protein [Sulfidibacter corallicola]|uniref:DUF1573 domain-containing protein n=1 Tax=Sulfidibacter corallicola TaxID=2818388 RepID=A0A8A4TBP3_SULCO|nr:DUF1573 domain-containing protein [Sulfidibacter corallicola]QTD47539.1 DUF1573 domain-containing protein [Sulfidibacter corallicola]